MRSSRVATLLQWHERTFKSDPAVSAALQHFIDFITSDRALYSPDTGSCGQHGGFCLMNNTITTGMVGLAVADLLQFNSTYAWGSPPPHTDVAAASTKAGRLKTDDCSHPSARGEENRLRGGVGMASCNLEGVWTGPPTDAKRLQINIVQKGFADNFTFFYSVKLGWVAGSIVGPNVTRGTVGTSMYPNLKTKAPAPPCTLLTFVANGGSSTHPAVWCKYPFCPHSEPDGPPPVPPTQVPLTLLPQDAGSESPAKLDGSQCGVYFAKSESGRSRKWTISIEGGGWWCVQCRPTSIFCHSDSEPLVLKCLRRSSDYLCLAVSPCIFCSYNEAECHARIKTVLGTSTLWPKALPFSADPYGLHLKQWEMGCMNAAENGTLDMDCNSIYLPRGLAPAICLRLAGALQRAARVGLRLLCSVRRQRWRELLRLPTQDVAGARQSRRGADLQRDQEPGRGG